ncbi:MAG: hypothetical protein IPL32_00145 [Chloracidobacterium sp.]|nr:hypothetical protein [Chloracidobacterium sp.]
MDGLGNTLTTKLYIPPLRRTLVERPWLLDQLNEGLKGKLTLVSAPAGFGKTSIVTMWHQQSEIPLAWISLDAEDNEPTRFLSYLVAGLRAVNENLVQETTNLLQIVPAPPIKVILTSLINEISAQEFEFVLALDDYHLIHEHQIHDALSFFIERLPPHAHALITTRSDPPFPLSRLRARGELKELRAADLRFGEAEVNTFLNDVMSLDLRSDDIAVLMERTEGWITGLQLSALSLQGKEDKSEFIKSFAGDNRFVLGYLLDEVLHLQSEQVQNFLLLTSVLGRFNVELCNTLTLNDDGHEIIEHLHRSNLFLIPLDNKNNWFRYHHLFADLLRVKLKQQRSDIVKELQTKASLWCEENDLLEEAIGYALATEDWDRALNLIEPIGYQLFSVARFDRLKRWADSIPANALRTHPMACYWFVLPLIYKEEYDEAERYLQIIETAEAEDLRRSLLSSVWSSRCYISIARADLEKSLDYGAKSLELLQPENTVQHVITKHAIVATSLLIGDTRKTERLTLDALPTYRQHDHVLFEVWGMIFLGYVRAMQGHLRAGAETLHATIKFINEKAPNRYEPLILPHSFLCDIYRELNDLENATIHLNEALKIIDKTGRESDIVLVPDSLKSLALMFEMSGDPARAQVLIDSGMNRMKKCGNAIFVRQLEALNALLCIRRGDVNLANSWGESCGLSPEDLPTYLGELEYLTFARWLIATEKAEQALPILTRLQKAAKAGSRQRIVLETLILETVVHRSCGNEAKALSTLEEALILAEPGAYVRSFVDEGESISTLLIECLKENGRRWEIEKPELLKYVIRLNDSFASTASHKPQKEKAVGADLPWWYVNDPLSERELEVMQLVAQGLSNHEIGNKIFISPGTVKRHLSNIYQKLDVHSRVQAIELARRFQLIPPFSDS